MSCILLITDPIRRNVLINLVIRFLFIWSSGFGLMTLSPHTEWSISESLAMAFVRYFQKREKLRNEGSQQDMPILKISSLFLQKKRQVEFCFPGSRFTKLYHHSFIYWHSFSLEKCQLKTKILLF